MGGFTRACGCCTVSCHVNSEQAMRPHFLTIVLPLLLAPTVHAADDDTLLAQLLTCQPAEDARVRMNMLKVLEARSTKNGDGRAKIGGRIQVGKLCIDNAELAAAFGVFMATGSMCDAEPAPLTDFLQQTKSDVKPTHPAPPAHVLAAFEAPKYSMTVYRGEPGFQPKIQEPASQRVSYLCAFQESGPQ